MFATSFKLAALKVACPNDNLQLTATPTLTFLSSDPTINSLTQPQLCKDLRTATKVVKRGPGCRIYVEVECDGVLPEGDKIEILKERLGLAIWGAPVSSSLVLLFCPDMTDSRIVVVPAPHLSRAPTTSRTLSQRHAPIFHCHHRHSAELPAGEYPECEH